MMENHIKVKRKVNTDLEVDLKSIGRRKEGKI
jgi:hypothetical protein